MIIQMQENMGKVKKKTEFLNICSRNQTLTELKKKLLLILRPMMKQILEFIKKALFFCCKQQSSVKENCIRCRRKKENCMSMYAF